MRLPGLKTAKHFSRWVRARALGGALILGYHRISAIEDDVYDVCVSPEHFAAQMETLRKYAHPIGLSKLVQCLKESVLPPRTVAVTFDDGYADNFYVAKPILEKYGIPATVFVCTGNLGMEFWWDELARLVMSSPADPRALHLELEVQFDWNMLPAGSEAKDQEVRRKFRRALYQHVLSLNVEEQNYAMHVIRKWSGLSSDGTRTTRTVNEEELLQLVDGESMDIGAHTRHHPMLPGLTPQKQREEIQKNKLELQALVGKPITAFAYPNGQVTRVSKQIVKESGFDCACTSLHDVVRPDSDIYELTRFWQKDVDGDVFMQGLNRWMRS